MTIAEVCGFVRYRGSKILFTNSQTTSDKPCPFSIALPPLTDFLCFTALTTVCLFAYFDLYHLRFNLFLQAVLLLVFPMQIRCVRLGVGACVRF